MFPKLVGGMIVVYTPENTLPYGDLASGTIEFMIHTVPVRAVGEQKS